MSGIMRHLPRRPVLASVEVVSVLRFAGAFYNVGIEDCKTGLIQGLFILHYCWINYLGPPTTSPSSPTAGAAGARALGSVPGAALKVDDRNFIGFSLRNLTVKVNRNKRYWMLIRYWIVKHGGKCQSLTSRKLLNHFANWFERIPSRHEMSICPPPRTAIKSFSRWRMMKIKSSGSRKSLRVIELLLKLFYPRKSSLLHNPVGFTRNLAWLSHRFLYTKTRKSKIILEGFKIKEKLEKIPRKTLRVLDMFHWWCPQNDKKSIILNFTFLWRTRNNFIGNVSVQTFHVSNFNYLHCMCLKFSSFCLEKKCTLD